MIVRNMQASDVDAVVSIEQANYHDPWTKKIFLDCLQVGYTCLILEDNSIVLGYAIIMHVLDEYHLLNIAIKKDYQNQGVGRYFLQAITDNARQEQGKYMFLEVRASNLAARHLYQSLGFIEVGLRKDYYAVQAGREDAVLYTLNLNQSG